MRFLSLKKALFCMIVILLSINSIAEQKVLTIESTITGSQEQPRVISIVPWQNIQEPKYLGKDLDVTIPLDVFQPIDRESFKQEINYIAAIRKK